MAEYTLQISDNLLAKIQQVAEKKQISVNQFFLMAIHESLENIQSTPKQPANLSKSWANYFVTARQAPDEFMEEVIDDFPQQRDF
jgi:hypothetical protein